jgi:hypothetical protein
MAMKARTSKLVTIGISLAIASATGCALHKPGETSESNAQDQNQCEHEAYEASGGSPGLLSNGVYRDCMRAKGYN